MKATTQDCSGTQEQAPKQRNNKGASVKEKVAAGVSIITLFLALSAGYATLRSDMARMEERLNNASSTNVQTLEVLNRLAESVDRLSHSVARLDERTKVLERDDAR